MFCWVCLSLLFRSLVGAASFHFLFPRALFSKVIFSPYCTKEKGKSSAVCLRSYSTLTRQGFAQARWDMLAVSIWEYKTASPSATGRANLAPAAASGDFPTGTCETGFVLKFAVHILKEYPSLKICGGSTETFCWQLHWTGSLPLTLLPGSRADDQEKDFSSRYCATHWRVLSTVQSMLMFKMWPLFVYQLEHKKRKCF